MKAESGSEVAKRTEADAPIPGDNEVVEEFDTEEVAGLLDVAATLNIGWRGDGRGRDVIPNHNNGLGVRFNGRSEDFPRVKGHGVLGFGHDMVSGYFLVSVQMENDKTFPIWIEPGIFEDGGSPILDGERDGNFIL
jgi:hypothetical protein